MTSENKSCYMCEQTATSREHVPPLSLFPKAKDVMGLNFRKVLITVPSCEVHNSLKSKDDEFLMIMLAGAVCNNTLAFWHNRTKINRALRRKGEQFLGKAILKNIKEDIYVDNAVISYPDPTTVSSF